jgi:ABC-type transport system substrate-binding protein
MRTSTITLHHVAGGLFGPGNLVYRCRENMYQPCPGLAESWEVNSDFTVWTFKVRDNAFWHDGQPFTVEDAKFWMDLAFFGYKAGDKTRAPAYFKGDLGKLEKVEILPGNRVRVTLGEPEQLYLEILMNPRNKIAHPKHLMEPRLQKGELNLAPLDIGVVGTGPFKLLKYEKGSKVQVRRFDRYWEKDKGGRQLPYLDGIDFGFTFDASAMDAALRVGRIDGGARGDNMYLSKERQAGYVRDLGDRVFYGEMQGGLRQLSFNVLRPGPWQDVRVRKAISFWMDKQASIGPTVGGFGYISPVLGPNHPSTNPDFLTWPGWSPGTKEKDRAEARRLLAEAGYAKGFQIGHMCRRQWVDRCEFFHAQLAPLNIEVKIQLVDDGGWNAGRVSLDYDTQQGTHQTSSMPEATEATLGVFSKNPDSRAKHEDRKIDEYYQRLRRAATLEQRVQLWRELERYYILEAAYEVPIAGLIQVLPYRSYVKGVVIPPEDGHTHTDFATVWLDK